MVVRGTAMLLLLLCAQSILMQVYKDESYPCAVGLELDEDGGVVVKVSFISHLPSLLDGQTFLHVHGEHSVVQQREF